MDCRADAALSRVISSVVDPRKHDMKGQLQRLPNTLGRNPVQKSSDPVRIGVLGASEVTTGHGMMGCPGPCRPAHATDNCATVCCSLLWQSGVIGQLEQLSVQVLVPSRAFKQDDIRFQAKLAGVA